jgi:hypothetical protein
MMSEKKKKKKTAVSVPVTDSLDTTRHDTTIFDPPNCVITTTVTKKRVQFTTSGSCIETSPGNSILQLSHSGPEHLTLFVALQTDRSRNDRLLLPPKLRLSSHCVSMMIVAFVS